MTAVNRAATVNVNPVSGPIPFTRRRVQEMFRVKCPICDGMLTIDSRSRKVTFHQAKDEAEQGAEAHFESIASKLQKAKSERQQRLEAAKMRETKRKAHVAKLFSEARNKARENPDSQKHIGPVWD